MGRREDVAFRASSGIFAGTIDSTSISTSLHISSARRFLLWPPPTPPLANTANRPETKARTQRHSIMPRQSRSGSSRQSVNRHRSTLSLQKTEILINVYDLLPAGRLSSVLWTVGASLLHSGVVINGKEYAFGGHDHPGVGRGNRGSDPNCVGRIPRHLLQLAHEELQPFHIPSCQQAHRNTRTRMAEPRGINRRSVPLRGSQRVDRSTRV